MSGRPWSTLAKYSRAIAILSSSFKIILFGPFWLADAILTAVYDNCLPSDECSIVTCKKKNRACNVLGLSHALDGLLFPCGAFLLFRLRADCLGIRQTG